MKRTLFLPLLAVASLSLTGCFEEESRTYSGPTLSEFRPGPSGAAASAYTRTLTNPATAAGPRRDSVVIQIIVAKPHTAPVTVNYEIDAASTAQATTDYVLTPGANSTANSVTFQPGTYSIPVYFNTVPSGLPVVTPARPAKTLIFNLMDTGDVKASKNYKTFRFNIAR